jgi:hypothetical protein
VSFASVRQIASLVLLTAGLLFGIDRLTNPRPQRIPGETEELPAGGDGPTIRLWFDDRGCGSCLGGLEVALSEVPWLEAPRVLPKVPPLEEAEQAPGVASEHPQRLVVEIGIPERHLETVDFVTLLAALRRAGFSAAQIAIGFEAAALTVHVQGAK